jgi:cytochrome b pre-mRNA-processing protein 3
VAVVTEQDAPPLVKQVRLGVTPEDGFGKASAAPLVAGMIFGLFGGRQRRLEPVDALFARIAEASRAPELYRAGGIPDDFEGRFESLCLHMFLLMRRLHELPAPAGDLAQDLVDACFSYLELGLRNGGVSDIAVPRRMKKIAQMFYGRIQAYETTFAADDRNALVDALRRNAGAGEGAELLAGYMLKSRARLAGLDIAKIMDDPALFPQLTEGET